MLKGVAGLGALVAVSGCARPGRRGEEGTHFTNAGRTDLIRRENEKPGTRDWMLKGTRIDPASKYRCPWIEGYCSRTSVRAGETISFQVSTNPASPFTLDIYRTGYYAGDGGRHVLSLGPFAGKIQPDPPVGPNRVRDCQWPPCASFKIPRDWLSGVYVGKLTAERERLQSYVIFIVRDDRRADFIFQCSDTTWQAYNRWPSQFALYDDGKDQWYWGGGVDVCFNRPYGKYCQIVDAPLSTGSGEWFLWEFPLAYWMESHGYDVTYISNLDTHADPNGLMRARGFLSVGHDEYYSLEMFNHLKTAIASGLNAGFFSGNTCCGRINPRPDSWGVPNRVYGRIGVFGPPGGTREFAAMKSLPHERPYANELVGAHRSRTGDRWGGLDLCKTGSLDFRGHGHETRRWHSGSGRLGVARRSCANSGSRSCGDRAHARRSGKTERRNVHRDGVCRTQGQLCIQRGYLLVGGQSCCSAWLCKTLGVYFTARSGPARSADHHEHSGADATRLTNRLKEIFRSWIDHGVSIEVHLCAFTEIRGTLGPAAGLLATFTQGDEQQAPTLARFRQHFQELARSSSSWMNRFAPLATVHAMMARGRISSSSSGHRNGK